PKRLYAAQTACRLIVRKTWVRHFGSLPWWERAVGEPQSRDRFSAELTQANLLPEEWGKLQSPEHQS
ncbi:MAG TPA: hypothetical protein DCQ32_08670, partial [Cyanobacteria bacterium UBA8156]|nr:hypothetical protein [Cyanobacteria bacterium UBA8156]